MVNKSSKILYIFMAVILLAIGVYAYVQQIPNPGQGGDSILVSIDDFTMTLQEAIDYEFLVDGAPSPTQSYTLEIPNPGHTGNEIYVSVDGVEMTLQEAIDSTGLSGSVLSSYSSAIAFGHSADEIWVSTISGEMSLQDAINSEEFSCIPDCIGKECGYDGCGGICGTCGSNAYCSSGTCACNAGWGDCNNDNTCECDLGVQECSGGSCVCLTTGEYSIQISTLSSSVLTGFAYRKVYCGDTYVRAQFSTPGFPQYSSEPGFNCDSGWVQGTTTSCSLGGGRYTVTSTSTSTTLTGRVVYPSYAVCDWFQNVLYFSSGNEVFTYQC